jgi:hypothetical protein
VCVSVPEVGCLSIDGSDPKHGWIVNAKHKQEDSLNVYFKSEVKSDDHDIVRVTGQLVEDTPMQYIKFATVNAVLGTCKKDQDPGSTG